jgi:predicted nucleotidyltransferase
MGKHLTDRPRQQDFAHGQLPSEDEVPVVPWLDQETAGLARAITVAVAQEHPEVVGIILFGSVARHDERPLSDSEPSDVDLLLLFDAGPGRERLPEDKALAIYATIGRALDRYSDAPREVQTLLAVRDLRDWDPLFVENVAREGILLWARGPLPGPLDAVAARSPAQAASA